MIAFRRYFAPGSASARQLSYQEILDSYFNHGFTSLEFHGFNYTQLSSKEVLPIVGEMVARTETKTLSMPSAHGRFLALNRSINERAAQCITLQRLRYDWFGCAKPGSAVPDTYNELNPQFL